MLTLVICVFARHLQAYSNWTIIDMVQYAMIGFVLVCLARGHGQPAII